MSETCMFIKNVLIFFTELSTTAGYSSSTVKSNDRSTYDRSANDSSAYDRSANDSTVYDRSANDRTTNDRTANDRTTNDCTANGRTTCWSWILLDRQHKSSQPMGGQYAGHRYYYADYRSLQGPWEDNMLLVDITKQTTCLLKCFPCVVLSIVLIYEYYPSVSDL